MKNGEYLHRPCAGCPFLRTKGAVRLMSARVKELTDLMLSPDGGEFPCHNTTKSCDEAGCNEDCDERHVNSRYTRHCAGALIFAEKHDNQTQVMRVAGRLGLYNPDKLERREDVFDTVEEMLTTAVDAKRPRKARR